MAQLRKFTLDKDEQKDRWDLTNDQTDRIIKTFNTKSAALRGGVLRRAVGPEGGSVKIQKENGRFQEERTFPRSRDPKHSKG